MGASCEESPATASNCTAVPVATAGRCSSTFVSQLTLCVRGWKKIGLPGFGELSRSCLVARAPALRDCLRGVCLYRSLCSVRCVPVLALLGVKTQSLPSTMQQPAASSPAHSSSSPCCFQLLCTPARVVVQTILRWWAHPALGWARASVADALRVALGLELQVVALPAAAVSIPEHVRRLGAAVDEMLLASAKHLPVLPPLCHPTPTRGWLRCMEATSALRTADAIGIAADAHSHFQGAHKSVLVSSCTVEKLHASGAKKTVDGLLAMHAKQTFPELPKSLAADPRLVLLLLDAPNLLTTKALTQAFPALRSSALAARVCIPQADPAHYSRMITAQQPSAAISSHQRHQQSSAAISSHQRHSADGVAHSSHTATTSDREAPFATCALYNVRFQRLDAWLDANASDAVRVPLAFFDYETSVYGRRSAGLSPLEDLQRFLRYGLAASPCLLGVTLSYRRDGLRHPPGAPVLDHDDLVDFVAHEAACAGMVSRS